MEKTIKEKYPFDWVLKRIKSKKPQRNENGSMLYKDALQYLARVMEQDNPLFEYTLTLASFATQNKLSEKQAKEADKIIGYFEKLGVL